MKSFLLFLLFIVFLFLFPTSEALAGREEAAMALLNRLKHGVEATFIAAVILGIYYLIKR